MGFGELKKKKWFKVMTNMYILVLTIFVIWMAFFDTNSMLIHLELRKEIKKLERQKEFLQGEIDKDKEVLKKLSDTSELEKFAREKYYMKKENEEIFLIEYEDSLKTKKNE
ncbi:FtsB family cell division protein [Flagellimonas allohymeniacidonis]|uniref:Septum formation initiator family protein n=1 Tax=Flagellimonas allohymeniacidonis TaxID=2517819 RepID=A0A4Q8QJ27_9FLAO|nr:septum formation initiator family protein [Allomuricauda hymeniacidonis]TAI49298.1 septum formation initiator family protein [Allomuricauda hymeniacidonis]